ncbi:MAG: hypothetical protein ACJA0H_001936 [Francisellaceae bacterium]|jgi:hypothetical protein
MINSALSEGHPLHEITHYDLQQQKYYLTGQPTCQSVANRIFEFHHHYNPKWSA